MIPNKLKDDAIVEAVCQVQFASQDLPEVAIGKLSDFPDASTYRQEPMPYFSIPAPVRRLDPNLKYQPLLKYHHASDGRLVLIGEHILAAHVLGAKKYPGWQQFRAHAETIFRHLFAVLKAVQVEKVTLRYINALVASRHRVNSPHDFRIKVSIAGQDFTGPLNLNVVERPEAGFSVTTRIASLKFVQGPLPPGTTAIVDVEVTPESGIKTQALADVLAWFEKAHALEKEAFFKLLPDAIIQGLMES